MNDRSPSGSVKKSKKVKPPKKWYEKSRRKKRTKFDDNHLDTLVQMFNENASPSSETITTIADSLGFDSAVVKNWFANRRQKMRRNNENGSGDSQLASSESQQVSSESQQQASNDSQQLLKPTQFVCPAYDDEVKDVQKQFMKTLFLSNVEFYKFVREHAGFDNFGLEELKSLAEAAKEVDHGMKQPEWLAKKWPNKGGKSTLQIIKEHSLAERLSRLSTPKLAKYRGGFLLGDFLDRAIKVMKNKQKSPRKMMLYSSHDGTLQSFLHVLGVADGLQVPYGACVLMEIYKNMEGRLSVKLLFRHGKETSVLKVKGCGEECSIDKFFETLESRAYFTKKDLYEACDRDDYCKPSVQDDVNAEKKKAKKQRRRMNSSRRV